MASSPPAEGTGKAPVVASPAGPSKYTVTIEPAATSGGRRKRVRKTKRRASKKSRRASKKSRKGSKRATRKQRKSRRKH
jgi:hypothetical protein